MLRPLKRFWWTAALAAAPFLNVYAGSVWVNSGATIRGSGTIHGDIAIQTGGAIAPGAELGCLATGSVTYLGSGQFVAQIGGAGLCSGYDQLQVSGAVALNGGLTVNTANGYTIPDNTPFTIISNGGGAPLSGTFSGIAEGGVVLVDASFYMYLTYLGGDGNDVAIVRYDDDNDGHHNAMDAFPSDPTEWVDSDGDGLGDNGDTDDDNDGMPDLWELANGLDPFDDSDATSDLDGDGVSNLNEYLNSSDPAQDDNPPAIIAPGDITANAVGLFTPLNIGSATASDVLDGVVSATSDAPNHFTPGVHTVTWSATDAAGNTGTDTQTVSIHPMADFAKDQSTSEGSTVTFRVILNGPVVSYPVSLPYSVSGSAATDGSDHNLANGTATINSGTEVAVSFTTVDDGAGEGLEQVVVTMGSPTNAVNGPKSTHTIEIIEGNVAPIVSLSATQGAVGTHIVTLGDGPVTVSSSVIDPNTGDSHSYDWNATDNALIDSDGAPESFVFDPSGLSAGLYTLRLDISDGTASDTAEISLNVVAAAPVLTTADSDGDGTDDQSEGYGDSDGDGIADYLDAIASTNVLQQQGGESGRYLMETEPGLKLTLNQVGLQANNGQAEVSMAEIESGGGISDDPTYHDYPGGLFDFAVSELPQAGQSVSIVLAQKVAIPAKAQYRKLMAGLWQEFVVDANNAIASAAGEQGYCPPPGDGAYQSGLAEGDWCVQLTIEDGGPNDDDGAANNSVVDPGGVAQILATDVNVAITSGGGGSLHPLWLLLLGLFGSSRLRAAFRRVCR